VAPGVNDTHTSAQVSARYGFPANLEEIHSSSCNGEPGLTTARKRISPVARAEGISPMTQHLSTRALQEPVEAQAKRQMAGSKVGDRNAEC
jgi:hypothetical protein